MARRALKPKTGKSLPEGYVYCGGGLLFDAQHLTRMRMPPATARKIMEQLSRGLAVHIEDAHNAIFHHAIAAITANGQSMGRRADGQAAMRLWLDVQEQVGLSGGEDRHAPPVSGMPDIGDLEAVESWLAS